MGTIQAGVSVAKPLGVIIKHMKERGKNMEMDNMGSTISNQKNKMSSTFKADLPNEMIEEQTKKIPNIAFLGLALAAMVGSLALSLNKKQELGNFVGEWVPTLLIFGLYNKMVKIEDELLRAKMH